MGFTRLFQLIFFKIIILNAKMCFSKNCLGENTNLCFSKNYLEEGGSKEGAEFYGIFEALQCLREFDFGEHFHMFVFITKKSQHRDYFCCR